MTALVAETSPPSWWVSIDWYSRSAPTSASPASAAYEAARFTQLAISAGDMPAAVRAIDPRSGIAAAFTCAR